MVACGAHCIGYAWYYGIAMRRLWCSLTLHLLYCIALVFGKLPLSLWDKLNTVLNLLRFTKHCTTRDSLTLALERAIDCHGVPLAVKFVKTLCWQQCAKCSIGLTLLGSTLHWLRWDKYCTGWGGLNIALAEVGLTLHWLRCAKYCTGWGGLNMALAEVH